MVKFELTKQEVAVLLQLMNGVTGLENAKVILPIYEKVKAAATAGD